MKNQNDRTNIAVALALGRFDFQKYKEITAMSVQTNKNVEQMQFKLRS